MGDKTSIETFANVEGGLISIELVGENKMKDDLKLLRLYPKKYHWYNRMIGMLECCKLEMYRNVIGPYESSKAHENGDVE